MTPRFRSALPPLDRRSRLPLALAAVLVAALAFQLAVPSHEDLPVAPPVGAGNVAGAPLPPVAPALGAPAILARQVFTPALIKADGAAAADPLDGYGVAGTIRVGRALRAVVTTPRGRVINVPPGGMIGPWRLAGLSATDARLVRGNERRIVPFGTNAAAAGPRAEGQ